MGLGDAGKKETEVAITFTLADFANGQILFTTSERARLGERSFGWGTPGGGGVEVQAKRVAYAVTAWANKAAFKKIASSCDRKWKGSVVDIKGANIFINAGSQQGMALQAKLWCCPLKQRTR